MDQILYFFIVSYMQEGLPRASHSFAVQKCDGRRWNPQRMSGRAGYELIYGKSIALGLALAIKHF
jgi:hypothetical protein